MPWTVVPGMEGIKMSKTGFLPSKSSWAPREANV
jgi:hypothetical protein